MKVLRLMKRLIISVFALAYGAVVVLCCISGPVKEGRGTSWIGVPRVAFAEGSYSIDESSIKLILHSGETELLKDFSYLESADFSGSECYEEIYNWGKENPQVQLRYSVPLPNGDVVDNSVTSLDFSGMDSETLISASALLKFLPELKSVELGVAPDEASALSAEALSSVAKALPGGQVNYSFFLHGQELSMDAESVDLSGITHDEVAAAATILSCIPTITYVNMGSAEAGTALSWEDIGIIQAACPNAEFDYSFKLYEQPVDFKTESLDLSYRELPDGGAALREVLPYLKNLTYVNMDSCGISNEDMAAMQAEFPDTKLVWRVWFGENYSVRTDVEKILASKPSEGGVLDNGEVEVLKYCTDVKYIDLGHNEAITDISFVNFMPNLEVMIIAMNPLTDISPLANCPKLEYLELNSTDVSDLTPLSNLQGLRHLNLGCCENVTDISPLYGLTKLERLWLGCNVPVSAEQVAEMQKNAPECVIDTTTDDPTQGGWRFSDLNDEGWYTWAHYGYFTFVNHPRYELLREQFGYDTLDYSFYYKDPTYKGEGPAK